MLRTFKLLPEPVSHEQVRTCFRQLKAAAPRSPQLVVTRREFPEMLLRIAIAAAGKSAELAGAAPMRKLTERELRVPPQFTPLPGGA